MSGKPLGATFGKWLLVGVLAAFVVLLNVGWGFITVVENENASRVLDEQVDYMNGLVEAELMLNDELKSLGLDPETAYDVVQKSVAYSMSRYRLWVDGMAAIAIDGVVLSSSVPEYNGMRMEEILESPVALSPLDALTISSEPLGEYRLPVLDRDYFVKTSTVVLDAGGGSFECSALVALPHEEVYSLRMPFVGWLAVVSGILLALVYVLVMSLLGSKVLRNIDTANDVLDKITEGDLEQRVDLPEVREFSSLAYGINNTVGALKESIAEAQTRINRELATAKAIQESALPSTFPPFPEIDAFDLYATMKAAREVGGDFYDFFLLEDNRLGIVMADVSGKGIPAALFMMAAKTEIRASMESGMTLAESLQTANYQLCLGNDAKMFVTVFAAVLDYATGRMEYANAGHNPPLLRHEGKWEWLREKSGLFLAAYPKVRYKTHELQLAEGDMLLLYTDGVTEAWNPDEELYGERRLESFLSSHADLKSRALAEALRRDLERWADGAEQADDITMLALEYGAEPLSTDTLKVAASVEELERVTDFVNGELARRMCPASRLNKVDICIEELFVNIARYAYGDGSGNAWVTYTYLTDPHGIRVELSDDGVPFDPLATPDPEKFATTEDMPIGGLGIFMTKNIADSLTYERRDGSNVVTFELYW